MTQHLGCRLLWIGPGCWFLCPLLLHFVLMRPIIVMMKIRLILSLFLAVLVFHPDIYSKEEARDGLSELRSMYLVAHFPQKQDINQFKWRAMKFVERGGTTRRNLVCVHVFENHSASHLPSRPPPTALYWGDPRHPQKGSIVRYLVALVEIPTLRAILFRG